MTKRTNDFLSIKQAMKEMLAENNLQKGITNIEVKQSWREVMGAGVVSYTDDILFKNNVLRVKLRSSALREELSYGKTKIISMLNEHLKQNIINDLKLI